MDAFLPTLDLNALLIECRAEKILSLRSFLLLTIFCYLRVSEHALNMNETLLLDVLFVNFHCYFENVSCRYKDWMDVFIVCRSTLYA